MIRSPTTASNYFLSMLFLAGPTIIFADQLVHGPKDLGPVYFSSEAPKPFGWASRAKVSDSRIGPLPRSPLYKPRSINLSEAISIKQQLYNNLPMAWALYQYSKVVAAQQKGKIKSDLASNLLSPKQMMSDFDRVQSLQDFALGRKVKETSLLDKLGGETSGAAIGVGVKMAVAAAGISSLPGAIVIAGGTVIGKEGYERFAKWAREDPRNARLRTFEELERMKLSISPHLDDLVDAYSYNPDIQEKARMLGLSPNKAEVESHEKIIESLEARLGSTLKSELINFFEGKEINDISNEMLAALKNPEVAAAIGQLTSSEKYAKGSLNLMAKYLNAAEEQKHIEKVNQHRVGALFGAFEQVASICSTIARASGSNSSQGFQFLASEISFVAAKIKFVNQLEADGIEIGLIDIANIYLGAAQLFLNGFSGGDRSTEVLSKLLLEIHADLKNDIRALLVNTMSRFDSVDAQLRSISKQLGTVDINQRELIQQSTRILKYITDLQASLRTLTHEVRQIQTSNLEAKLYALEMEHEQLLANKNEAKKFDELNRLLRDAISSLKATWNQALQATQDPMLLAKNRENRDSNSSMSELLGQLKYKYFIDPNENESIRSDSISWVYSKVKRLSAHRSSHLVDVDNLFRAQAIEAIQSSTSDEPFPTDYLNQVLNIFGIRDYNPLRDNKSVDLSKMDLSSLEFHQLSGLTQQLAVLIKSDMGVLRTDQRMNTSQKLGSLQRMFTSIKERAGVIRSVEVESSWLPPLFPYPTEEYAENLAPEACGNLKAPGDAETLYLQRLCRTTKYPVDHFQAFSVLGLIQRLLPSIETLEEQDPRSAEQFRTTLKDFFETDKLERLNDSLSTTEGYDTLLILLLKLKESRTQLITDLRSARVGALAKKFEDLSDLPLQNYLKIRGEKNPTPQFFLSEFMSFLKAQVANRHFTVFEGTKSIDRQLGYSIYLPSEKDLHGKETMPGVKNPTLEFTQRLLPNETLEIRKMISGEPKRYFGSSHYDSWYSRLLAPTRNDIIKAHHIHSKAGSKPWGDYYIFSQLLEKGKADLFDWNDSSLSVFMNDMENLNSSDQWAFDSDGSQKMTPTYGPISYEKSVMGLATYHQLALNDYRTTFTFPHPTYRINFRFTEALNDSKVIALPSRSEVMKAFAVNQGFHRATLHPVLQNMLNHRWLTSELLFYALNPEVWKSDNEKYYSKSIVDDVSAMEEALSLFSNEIQRASWPTDFFQNSVFAGQKPNENKPPKDWDRSFISPSMNFEFTDLMAQFGELASEPVHLICVVPPEKAFYLRHNTTRLEKGTDWNRYRGEHDLTFYFPATYSKIWLEEAEKAHTWFTSLVTDQFNKTVLADEWKQAREVKLKRKPKIANPHVATDKNDDEMLRMSGYYEWTQTASYKEYQADYTILKAWAGPWLASLQNRSDQSALSVQLDNLDPKTVWQDLPLADKDQAPTLSDISELNKNGLLTPTNSQIDEPIANLMQMGEDFSVSQGGFSKLRASLDQILFLLDFWNQDREVFAAKAEIRKYLEVDAK